MNTTRTYDFPFMAQMARQARAKLKRYLKYHGENKILSVDTGAVLRAAIVSSIKEMGISSDVIPVGVMNQDDAAEFKEREDAFLRLIKNDIEQAIISADLRLKQFYWGVSADTLSNALHWSDRGNQLDRSLKEKETLLADYYCSIIEESIRNKVVAVGFQPHEVPREGSLVVFLFREGALDLIISGQQDEGSIAAINDWFDFDLPEYEQAFVWYEKKEEIKEG